MPSAMLLYNIMERKVDVMFSEDSEDDVKQPKAATRKANSISAAVGKEPALTENSSESEVIRAFNWYNYSCDANDAKKYVVTYLMKNFSKSASSVQKTFGHINAYEVGSVGWMCKQILNGNKLPEYYERRRKDRLLELISIAQTRAKKEETDSRQQQTKVSPRKVYNQTARFLIAEIDSHLDTLDAPYSSETEKEILDVIKAQNPSPIALEEIRSYYASYRDEVTTFLSTSKKNMEEQLLEHYSKVPVRKLKNLSKFFDVLFEHVTSAVLIKKRMRKPRAKKTKTSAQLTKKLKFKDYDDKYKIKSIQPTDVVGSLQLWVFNTKTRKLGVYHADDTSALSVKGSTIIGYNKTSSVQKTLRKPEDIILQVASGSKVQLRHVMSGIKAKASPLNGRINSETILLRSTK